MLKFINGRLSFGQRLLALALIFATPAFVAVALFAQQSWKDIAFAQRELVGTAYLEAVWPVFQAEASGVQPDAGAIAAFKAASAQYDHLLNTADASAAFANATGQRAALAGQSLIVAIADSSNLTLDPDLDSYYSSDAATVTLPALAITAGNVSSQPPTVAPEVAAVNQDRLKSTLSQALSDIGTAIAKNADGKTKSALASTQADLTKAVTALTAAPSAEPVLRGLDGGGTQAETGKVIDAAWGATNKELERLLQARIQRLMTNLGISLSAIVGLMLLGVFFGSAIARGLTSRVGALVNTMGKLTAGEINVDVPYKDDRNEIGQIARALQIFREALARQAGMESEKVQLETAASDERSRTEAERLRIQEETEAAMAILGDALQRLSAGDLTVRIDHALPSEFAKLQTDFNIAVEKLQSAMGVIVVNIRGITTGSTEISQAADDLARRTEHQAATLEETAAALDEITATVHKSAGGARDADAAVATARGDAERSGQIVQRAVTAMAAIDASSSQISHIIGVIDEIAFQTNLLALNAGVEAARAGDAGKGFAVVASEVRALAQRSAEAAREIKSLILTSSQHVKEGVELVDQTGSALKRIFEQVGAISGLVAEIAGSAQEQSTALAEVNTAVNQMDQVTQQNAAMVEESTAASHALTTEARELARLMERFKLGEVAAAGHHAAEAAPMIQTRAASPRPVPQMKTTASYGGGGAAPAPMTTPDADSWEEF
jgi:methyl-accepting chemotaxis protein